jgi:hypothetical protein
MLLLRRAGMGLKQTIALFPIWEEETIVAPHGH